MGRGTELDEREQARSAVSLSALSLIRFVTFARDTWRRALRQAEGLLRVLGAMLGFGAPDYTTLWRRELVDELYELETPQADEHSLLSIPRGYR